MSEGLHFRTHGDVAERALLLVHPLGADLSFWDDCIPLWRHEIGCIACDLRAAGDSPRSAEPVSIGRHVADLEALRREIGTKRVVPVGCAIGAMIAASYAAHHPASTAALVLTNPTLRTSETARAMLAGRAESVRQSGMAAVLPGAVDRAFLEQPRDARYERYFRRFADQDPQGYVASVLGILDADISQELPSIDCPTLILAGGRDVLLPPENARAVHERIRGSAFALIDDAAHFLPYQKPELFAERVLRFLLGCLGEAQHQKATGVTG